MLTRLSRSFCYNAAAATELYTLSLHDALPIYLQREEFREAIPILQQLVTVAPEKKTYWMQLSSVYGQMERSEEHTSELQSQSNLVCRLLLEKKNTVWNMS